jgi:hypothetical protein
MPKKKQKCVIPTGAARLFLRSLPRARAAQWRDPGKTQSTPPGSISPATHQPQVDYPQPKSTKRKTRRITKKRVIPTGAARFFLRSLPRARAAQWRDPGNTQSTTPGSISQTAQIPARPTSKGYAPHPPPKISPRFVPHPKTASRTRVIVACACTRAVFDPASIISSTLAGCFSYSNRRSRIGAIHSIK